MKNILFAICLIFVCFVIALIFIENRKNVVSYSVNANFVSGDWWKTATVADVEKEIQNGADVNAKNVYGYTVLMKAAQNTDNPEIIATLIKHGANINTRHADYGRNALMVAAAYNNNPEIIETLIQYGANVNEPDEKYGYTALIEAVYYTQNPEIIETLIRHGADVNAVSGYGLTVLMCAAQMNNRLDILETLVKHGANVNIKNKAGKTAWDYAKENPNIYLRKDKEEIYSKLKDLLHQ